MKSFFFLLIVTLITSINTKAQSNSSLKEKVQKAHQSFFDGILSENYKQVDELLDENVTLGFPDGNFTPKKEYLDGLKNGTLFYDSSFGGSSQIRTFGNTGVVNGKSNLIFRYKYNGDWFRMLEHLSYTAVYSMDKNEIKMVAWQSNRAHTDSTEKLIQ